MFAIKSFVEIIYSSVTFTLFTETAFSFNALLVSFPEDKNPDLGEAEKLALIEKTVNAALNKLGHPEALNQELIIKTIQKVLAKAE